MSEGEPPDRLTHLGERIERARAGESPVRPSGRGGDALGGALGYGLRIGAELLAALIVGVALGWTCDHFLGTRPWGLIAFFFIGAAAGIMNVYRATQKMGRGTGR
jgi:ATP synthase protein I